MITADNITADNITDEQIRELRMRTGWIGARCKLDQETISIALADVRTLSRQHAGDAEAIRREARARCAEFLNAREARRG